LYRKNFINITWLKIHSNLRKNPQTQDLWV
jgi:hypothetical protein